MLSQHVVSSPGVVCDSAGIDHLGVTSFVAKISDDNAPSLALFQSKLGFAIAHVEPAFQETHLRLEVTPDAVASLRAACPDWRVEAFERPALSK